MAPVSVTSRFSQVGPTYQTDVTSGCKRIAIVTDLRTSEVVEPDDLVTFSYSEFEERTLWNMTQWAKLYDQGSTGSSHGHSLTNCIQYIQYIVRQNEKQVDLTIPKPNRKQRRAALSDSRRKKKRGR